MFQNVLVTGGAGYIGESSSFFPFFSIPTAFSSSYLGSHVVYCLQKTRRYKVISIDNGHNSLPEALLRVGQLSREELPPDASEQDIQSTEIDIHNVDLTKAEQVRAVFEKYGKGGIWGVIHIAVSPKQHRSAAGILIIICRHTKPLENLPKSPSLITKIMFPRPSHFFKSCQNSSATGWSTHHLPRYTAHLPSFLSQKAPGYKQTVLTERQK